MKGRQSHETLVKGLIDYFISENFEIKYANYEGYAKPMKINRHPPDIIAYNPENSMVFVAEAKLCSELRDQITCEQFEDYPKRLMEKGKFVGKYIPFFIGVPQDCVSKIQEVYRHFEIPWSDNIYVIGF